MDEPLMTIRTRVFRQTLITVGFGTDRHYDLTVSIDPANMGDDDEANDHIARPGCRVLLGGLNHTVACNGAKEITVERWLGEDDLRAMGKALLAAAGKLRRIESGRRRIAKGQKEADDE